MLDSRSGDKGRPKRRPALIDAGEATGTRNIRGSAKVSSSENRISLSFRWATGRLESMHKARPISTVALHRPILLLPRPIRGHPCRPVALHQDGRTMHAAADVSGENRPGVQRPSESYRNRLRGLDRKSHRAKERQELRDGSHSLRTVPPPLRVVVDAAVIRYEAPDQRLVHCAVSHGTVTNAKPVSATSIHHKRCRWRWSNRQGQQNPITIHGRI